MKEQDVIQKCLEELYDSFKSKPNGYYEIGTLITSLGYDSVKLAKKMEAYGLIKNLQISHSRIGCNITLGGIDHVDQTIASTAIDKVMKYLIENDGRYSINDILDTEHEKALSHDIAKRLIMWEYVQDIQVNRSGHLFRVSPKGKSHFEDD